MAQVQVYVVINHDRENADITARVFAMRVDALEAARAMIKRYRLDPTINSDDVAAALREFDESEGGSDECGGGDPNCRFYVTVQQQTVL